MLVSLLRDGNFAHSILSEYLRRMSAVDLVLLESDLLSAAPTPVQHTVTVITPGLEFFFTPAGRDIATELPSEGLYLRTSF